MKILTFGSMPEALFYTIASLHSMIQTTVFEAETRMDNTCQELLFKCILFMSRDVYFLIPGETDRHIRVSMEDISFILEL